MFRFCTLPVLLLFILLYSCSEDTNPTSSNLLASKFAEIELGGIVASRAHFAQSQSGPYNHSSSRDTTPYTYLYSFSSSLYDSSISSFRDSSATLLYTMKDFANEIHIAVTLDTERRFIQSLKIEEWRRSYYPEQSTTHHKIETGEILQVTGPAGKHVFEVRGQALATILQYLEYTFQKEWHSNGPSWSYDEYSLLPEYEVTPDSYLRITLSK